jgi:putative SOS response-associated peptidase YedK
MCNLYSLTRAQDAIRALFRVVHDRTGNLPPMLGIFPDYPAPIVRLTNGERELAMARWGMPSPQFALKGKATDPGVTNVRNVASAHWRRWLGPANRCIVPFTSFSEYETGPDGKKVPPSTKADLSPPSPASGPAGRRCGRPKKAKSPPTYSPS